MAMVAMVVLSTGCGAFEDFIGVKEVTQVEDIETYTIRSWYTEVTGDDGEDVSNTDMKRMIVKKEIEKENPGYWGYEHEYDRVQTFHAYGENGRLWMTVDLDEGEVLDFGREE